MGNSSLIQGDQEAAINHRSTDALVTPDGKSYTPFEPALRQFQSVDDGRPKRGRKYTGPRYQEICIVNNRLNLVGVHARQRHKNQHLEICFQNIDRRFP
jgi:hypothetical protein